MAKRQAYSVAYRLRLKRKRLLWRAMRSRHQLTSQVKRPVPASGVLCFGTIRNEAVRLPYFLAHHRALGVRHFLFVDNASTDGTAELLASQPDVSLWRTEASYRASRFGMDWVGWLLMRYGHGRWCLTLDADELLIYPDHDRRPLDALTGWLEGAGLSTLPCMMLDLYPKGPVQDQTYTAGDDPVQVLPYFDGYGYQVQKQQPMQNLWLQGGPRARMFFADRPDRAPTLNKTPLVRWNRRYAYVNSTHSALPPRLNWVTGDQPTGVLLHTKFLPDIVTRSGEEKQRGEHFGQPSEFDDYYDSLAANPDLWVPQSLRFTGADQLEHLGLMQRGTWAEGPVDSLRPKAARL